MKMIEMIRALLLEQVSMTQHSFVFKQLVEYVKDGDKVLDLGCGSGILSIVAKKLNASKVI